MATLTIAFENPQARGEPPAARVVEFESHFWIGRCVICNLVCEDETVSRLHAVIEKTGSGYVISDMRSLNGTLVGGKKVVRQALREGDQVTVGMSRLTFSSMAISGGSRMMNGDRMGLGGRSICLKTFEGIPLPGLAPGDSGAFFLGEAVSPSPDLMEFLKRGLDRCLIELNAQRGILMLHDASGTRLTEGVAREVKDGTLVDSTHHPQVLVGQGPIKAGATLMMDRVTVERDSGRISRVKEPVSESPVPAMDPETGDSLRCQVPLQPREIPRTGESRLGWLILERASTGPPGTGPAAKEFTARERQLISEVGYAFHPVILRFRAAME